MKTAPPELKQHCIENNRTIIHILKVVSLDLPFLSLF